ncbi:hypothetical protein OHA74_53255 [Streptomyces phaeochromogenes]|uniref:hypothetical protein n=1 Tax=Streptomyces phaeochromogenes TaxID=1923 RepID=UPI002E28F86C|nr:hypothetical protein [Streptomyces phaeochromogenes]
MKRRGIAAAIVATAALLIGGVMSISASASGADSGPASSTSEPPPLPPWVNADGTVDNSKMPDKVPVVGPDGKPLKDAQGNEVYVDPRSFDPQTDLSEKRAVPDEKRWTETDENGVTTEHVEVEPTVPAAAN